MKQSEKIYVVLSDDILQKSHISALKLERKYVKVIMELLLKSKKKKIS